MVKGIAQQSRYGPGPRNEFVVRIRSAGTVFLVDTARAHGPPLVVIALEPDFKKIVELPIFCDVAWVKVAVIIENRLGGRKFEIEPAGRIVVEKKIIADKRGAQSRILLP